MTLGRLARHVAEVPSYATATIRLEKLEMTAAKSRFRRLPGKKLLETFRQVRHRGPRSHFWR